MINLLPPGEKQNLSENKRLKIVLILNLIVFVFFVSLALIFASIAVATSSKVAAQKILLSQKEQNLMLADTQGLKNKIIQINQNLIKLDSFYKKSPGFVDFLDKISDFLPKGIHLKTLSVSPLKIEDNLFQVHLSGEAVSVEEIIKLDKNLKILEKDGQISQIYFPGETWLGKDNFSFWLTFQAVIGKPQ